MPNTSRSLVVFAAVLLTALPVATAAGQFAISPFLSYVPSSASNPYAGMALTMGGTTGGLAIRASGDMEIPSEEERRIIEATGRNSYRFRAADADAMLNLGGLGGGGMHGIRPYVFAGVGLVASDSMDVDGPRRGWSYGTGAALLLGRNIDVFGEARWRMSEFVLPTSDLAPSPEGEFRFGLTFRTGGGSR
ncbi:MAG TPA: hypothetical protein VFT29_17205 [Gemmatimonadaceae bacterium]|nr:hypothetical protein [Gemmatimonadaceae bacterium]